MVGNSRAAIPDVEISAVRLFAIGLEFIHQMAEMSKPDGTVFCG